MLHQDPYHLLPPELSLQQEFPQLLLLPHPEFYYPQMVQLLPPELLLSPDPCFPLHWHLLHLLYLKNLYILHDISFGGELRKAVLYIADRRQLFRLIEGDRYALHPHASAYNVGKELEKEPSIDRTLSLIDAFLATVPEEHSQTTELDYAMDYTAYLIRDDEETNETDSSSTTPTEVPKLRGQDLIDGFIRQSETEEGISLKLPKEDNPLLLPLIEEETDEAEEEKVVVADETPRWAVEETEQVDSCFTETLAIIYINLRGYD